MNLGKVILTISVIGFSGPLFASNNYALCKRGEQARCGDLTIQCKCNWDDGRCIYADITDPSTKMLMGTFTGRNCKKETTGGKTSRKGTDG